ncbi:TPA: phage tail tape measure protein [Escherichia coli]|uniref:phage tail tape measure protein n=1 Tax=Enterobacter roggenkampii TaxID=1812935 RepID=UPI000E02CA0F|nr:phage tail tape measure protein [Enterobacter roggenkampii]EFH7923185.1 phage tail tape measure protein [Escherichia coli]HBY7420595.1 phage tail tape measure protein [Klebsiella pneumoniae]MDN3751939.1 phage tail tape measure protein [Enterobacter roggenkampii]MDN3761050.1 phage tail tape measure protein [Enterobacter roggenkampii]MDN3771492.1 phage tail tape measure protein [Enterobacter roggenkampii]
MDLSIRVAFSAIDKLTRPVSAASKAIGGLSDSLKKTQSSIKDLEKSATSFDKLRSQANDTAQKLKSTQRAFNGLNQKQREGGQLTEAQTARLESLRTRLSRLTETYGRQTTQLRTAAQAVRQHGVNLTTGSGAIQSAIRRTEQYNQALERERRQLAATQKAQARYEQAKETAGKLRGAGMGMMLGTAAAGYAGGSFLAPAIGFDEEMSRVQALTRLNKDSSQMGDLRAQAKKLGAETAFTSRDAASGQAFLAMAGFTPEAIQAALPGVLNMALAGGMDLGESADISSNILSQFRLDPKEMDRVSDVLTAAFTRTNTDLMNIGEAMKYAGTGMAGLGVDVERTTAMIGVMANVGLRGSIAGTGLQTTFSRLAAPTGKAQAALKELGVSVADATGKMRPAEVVLSDIYKSIKKYGDTDQLSFFKDIAGEEAAKSFQALVRSAGSGELQKLLADLRGSQGEAQKAAKVMADNLSGDLKNLDSAWEGFRIQIEETADGPLRSLTQGLSDMITAASTWVKENPRLTQTIILVVGGTLALVAAIGAASLAMGILIGPLAKLQLGFSLLTGGRGLLGTIAAFRTLGTVAGPAMASVRGWSVVLSGIAPNLGRISAILPAVRSGLLTAFLSPGALVGSLTKNIGMLLLRLTGLPAIWGMITGAISVLGGALSFLLSPIGLIGAAFVSAGLLIWRYWEPIKTFFLGMFTGVMQAISPLRDAFATFSPIFDMISNGVKSVWQWFTNLLSPMQTSKETLDKCASAGVIFGNVLGGAINLVLTPARMLLDTLGWILEKLGVLPDEAERARKKIEDAQRSALLQDKVAFLAGDMAKVAPKKAESPVTTAAPAAASPLSGNTGTQRRLQSIADNTKATADNTKKVGPGDIIFKNLPRALALRGAYQEARVTPQSVPRVATPAAGGIISATAATQAPVSAPVTAPTGNAPVFNITFNDVGKRTDQELERMVRNVVRDAMASTNRNNRGSFRDRD